jgi:DNA-binding NtrC family response regulator
MSQRNDDSKRRVLVTEDDEIARVTLTEQLKDAGYDVEAFQTAEGALEALKAGAFDVAVSDVRLPGMDGVTFLEQARRISPQTLVILLTGFGTVGDAVRAMRLGAADYLCKPVSAEEVAVRMEKALAFKQADSDRERLQQEVEQQFSYHNVIGHSAGMQSIFRLMELVKDIDSTVLIEGETGTGKDLLARAMHFSSNRRQYPFVSVNCMVLSRDLLVSELFGHERGAFTGAYKDSPGRFEMAGKGTVLLDDVDDIPLDLQGKLVYALEQRKCERVGSTKQIHLDCRVICATKKNLADLVREGRFRDDLYYRMNVLNLRIPPLRERKDDIPWLAAHFLKVYGQRRGRGAKTLSDEAMRMLHSYDWPGNVRELEHVIERAVVLCAGQEIGPIELPSLPQPAPPAREEPPLTRDLYTLRLPEKGGIDLPALLGGIERDAIDWAMARSEGQQAAAELLNVPRTTFQAKYYKRAT